MATELTVRTCPTGPLVNSRYELLRPLGRGATATVFECRESPGGARLALKLLHEDADETLLRSEFTRLSRWRHPHLVRVHDLDRLRTTIRVGRTVLESGRLFLVMDLVDGEDPLLAVERTPPGEREAVVRRVAEGLARALGFLHGHRVLHHDVKPANVLITVDGRAVLLDLGLAARAGAGLTRGTPLYLAPEALAGAADFRSDLWSLGATLFHLAEGRPPFEGRGPALVRRILEESPRLSAPWLSADLRELVLSLLRKDPARRPGSARRVLAELARAAGDHRAVAELSSRRELLPPALVGREAQLGLVARALSGGPGAPRVVLVAGPPGCGKTRLIEEALRRQRLLAAAGRVPPVAVTAGLPVEQGPFPDLEELALHVAELVEHWAGQERLVIHLADAEADPLAGAVLRALALTGRCPGPREGAGGGPLVVAELGTEAARALAGPGSLLVELPPLGRGEIAAAVSSMLGAPAPSDLVERIAELSRGNPTLVTELTRQWHEAGEEGLRLERLELGPLLARSRARLAPELARLMDALAAWAGPASAAELAALVGLSVAEVWPCLEELARRGSLVLDAGLARFPSAAHATAWAGIIPDQAARALHARAADLLGPGAPAPRLAGHLLAAGAADAAGVALRAARELVARHDTAPAVRLLEQVVRGGQEPAAREARPLLADLYLQTGRYGEALELLDGKEPEHRLLRAQALQRSGDYAGAEALLVELVPLLEDEELRLQASASLARLLLQGGRPAQATASLDKELRRVLARPPAEPLGRGAAACLEAAGFALLQQGLLAEADRLFARGEQCLQSGEPARLARFVDFRGMVAFAAGELPIAASHYRRALELLGEGGDAHGRATYLCNLGSTLLLTGRYAEALDRLTAALHDLERLARNTEVASSYCNLANLLLALGDLEQANRLCRRGLDLARRLGSRHTEAHLLMLEGDLFRRGACSGRRGEAEDAASFDQALARYREAAAIFEQAGAARERLLCEIAEAETLIERGDLEEAGQRLAGMRPAADQQGVLAAAWARLQLAAGGTQQIPEDTERTLASHCAELERRGADPELWRASALLGRLLLGRGRRAAARRALDRARRTWENIMSHAPDLYRERMSEEPEVRSLAQSWEALLEAGDESAEAISSSGHSDLLLDPQRLRRLLAINKRLNSELRLPRLLELIMDTVIELTGAERGFLLLAGENGRLTVKVARNIDQAGLQGEGGQEHSLSRSIAEKAAQSGLPVVTVDAAADGRFREALSVSDLHLRSVLAVPLRVKGSTVGTVYVDSRLRQGLFGEAEVRLLQDLADQAAIAIDNARLLAENRRRQREIERLNQRLRRKVQTQQAELDEVREELRSSREVLQQRNDYHGIVGRSPKMRDLFRLLDRVVETELPVVVQGESGTGKELVARAIHNNGRRASRPFVSENCAAIPETLLESILFGHVRGAFTGADRDRKGLFEVASGGTLFLDEVGETSPAMQTKLLRVLQDGELRRVGGTQTLRADVRVIAASNKDLSRLVAEGRFREDLYYRLNVIQIEIPPLRERREDIPLLVDHFLRKHSAGVERRLSPEAMALLVGYAWPGNVRELENEVLRAAALAGKLIEPRDLSPHVADGVPLSVVGRDELNLRLRVEHLERELLGRALEQTRGNHTQAASRLGLSRFGLLKKLRRYGLDSPPARATTSLPSGRERRQRS